MTCPLLTTALPALCCDGRAFSGGISECKLLSSSCPVELNTRCTSDRSRAATHFGLLSKLVWERIFFFFFWIRARTQNSYVQSVPTLFSHWQYKRKRSYAGEHKPHVTPLNASQLGRRQSKGSTRHRGINMRKLWAVSCITQLGEKQNSPWIKQRTCLWCPK